MSVTTERLHNVVDKFEVQLILQLTSRQSVSVLGVKSLLGPMSRSFVQSADGYGRIFPGTLLVAREGSRDPFLKHKSESRYD